MHLLVQQAYLKAKVHTAASGRSAPIDTAVHMLTQLAMLVYVWI